MNSRGQYSNIDIIKKNILYDTLVYNIHEQDVKSVKKKQEREKEKEEYQIINRKASMQLGEQKQRQRTKKNYMRHILAEDYDRQIREREIHKQQQIRQNRSYAQIEEESQNQREARRARDLAKIYRAQRTVTLTNPETENIRAKLSPQLDRSDKKVIATQNDELHNPQGYADYLKHEIERKRIKKEQQRKEKEKEQHLMVQRNSDSLSRELEEQKNYQLRQKMALKKGLDEQVSLKKQHQYWY